MKKERTKNARGITLIALVITIIVLLILAGVSIAMLTGENGVLTKATEAKSQTEIAQEKEEIQMAYAAAKANKVEQVADDVTATELNTELDKLNSEGTASGSGTLTVKFTKRQYKIEQSTGKISGPTEIGEVAEEDTLVYMYKKAQEENCLDGSTCNKENHLHIGDYVNYEPVVGTTKESKEEENGYGDQKVTVTGEDEWRVLGLSEDGTQVLLTSDGVIKEKIELSNDTREGLNTRSSSEKPENFLAMYGAESYVNCEQSLDNISSAFGTGEGAEKAVSMRIENVNRTLGVEKEGNGIYLKEDTGRTNNIDIVGVLGRTYTTTREEEYTPESFLRGEKLPIGTPIELTSYGYEKDSVTVNETIKNLIFAGIEANPYWLASPGVYDIGAYASFGPGAVIEGSANCAYYNLFDSFGIGHDHALGVRPVVYLQSDVTKDTISRIIVK